MTAAQEIVREVGISHCNNIRSLIDHAHGNDSAHYIIDTFRKELLSFLWDLGYYLTKKERDEVLKIFDDVQHAITDMHFQETVDNYHRHYFDIHRHTESKGLRSWATDGIAITHMYKQLVMESKRVPTKQTEQYINELIDNFLRELKAHNEKMSDLLKKYRSRNAAYNPVTTPLMPIEIEDYEPKKGIKDRRGDPTWLKTHGDRPNHTLGLPKHDEPLPTGDQTSFQGGRNLYEKYFQERKTALNEPKYMYKVEQIQARNEAIRQGIAQAKLAKPQIR